nr:MAG: NEDD4 family-interacting protein 1-like [Chiromantes dehaani nimavirus]
MREGKKGREPSPDYSRQQQQQHLRHPAAKFNMHVPLSPPSLPDSPPSYEEVQQQQQPSPLKALEAAQSSGGAGGNAMGGGLDPETEEIELGPFFVAFISGAILLWGTGWLCWYWLIWFIMALCILICMCIILYYAYAKRKWHQVPRHILV